MAMDRRQFLANSGTLLAGAAAAHPLQSAAQTTACGDQPRQEPLYTQQQQYRIGYTTNTRGGWEGDPFKGMREAREAGFRYMEIFGTSFCRPDALYYPDKAEGLMRRIFEMGVNFVSITGGAAEGNTSSRIPLPVRRWSRTTSQWPASAGGSVARCKRPTRDAGAPMALRMKI